MYVPINPLGYSCIKKLQRDNLLHAYNEPINIYSGLWVNISENLDKAAALPALSLITPLTV